MARSFFNRLGEIRDRSFENQRYRASGLNLVVAAISLCGETDNGGQSSEHGAGRDVDA